MAHALQTHAQSTYTSVAAFHEFMNGAQLICKYTRLLHVDAYSECVRLLCVCVYGIRIDIYIYMMYASMFPFSTMLLCACLHTRTQRRNGPGRHHHTIVGIEHTHARVLVQVR